ncbi:NAD(P)/FAD-dependent oxidoreductase [Roseibium aquae]|uniref:NAD(P)/FAD-dependent oxidoreductase n=1 Tax=Roseibium aquae TaxID=1323746 RepID=UPI00123D1F18|nr:FAD-dependent oxidoreductase [Roseibium aquae]
MPSPLSDPPFDLVVCGGGVFGLSLGYRALKSGLKVAVLEKDRIGAGASGGLLGALMPHMPARWNAKKEFQYQSLKGMADHIAGLEEATGLPTGYARCGRILPLTSEDKLIHHRERAQESRLRWSPQATGFTYEVEPAGRRSDWLSPSAAPFGLVYETLAARLSPRAYLAALAAYISAHGQLLEGADALAFDEQTGQVRLASGGTIAAGAFVYANGYAAFAQLSDLTGETIGRGEKGQALILEGSGLEGRPAIYCDGLYVVPHDNGTVAVGSTSERHATDTAVDPAATKELLTRAIRFCPALEGRAIQEEWAGVRPRCHKRDPMIGRLPGTRRTYAALGGFKISFGIAHLIADALVCEIVGTEPAIALPETFRPSHHFGVERVEADAHR